MQFAVIGLGKFGLSAALELQQLGNKVTGIDLDEKVIEKLDNKLSAAVIADGSDQDALEQLQLNEYNGVLVGLSDNLETGLLCVLNLQNLQVKNIWAKAKNQAHATILKELGIKNVILPEQDMGLKIAQEINYPMVKQYIPMGTDHFIIKIVIQSPQVIPLTKLKNKYPHCYFFMVRRDDQIITELPEDFTLIPDDRLLVLGKIEQLKSLTQDLS